jgi:hypothetical protein
MKIKILTAVSACLAALALVGCAAHTHSVIADDSDRDIKQATFRHEEPEQPAMTLEFAGKRYEASGFAINRKQNLAELKRRYDPKHYDRIFSGLDTDHYVYSAEPLLRATDGATLRCFMAWRSGAYPAGTCTTDDGTRIYVRFGPEGTQRGE